VFTFHNQSVNHQPCLVYNYLKQSLQ